MSEDDPEIGERVARLEADMSWVKEKLSNLDQKLSNVDRRLWWILGSVVVFGVLAILVTLLK